MDSTLSERHKLLLIKACKDNGGVISITLARRMYSSKSSAKSAVDRLELFDFIERTTPGHWKVVKLPNDVKRELKHIMGDEGEVESGSEKNPENREDSSEFKIEA